MWMWQSSCQMYVQWLIFRKVLNLLCIYTSKYWNFEIMLACHWISMSLFWKTHPYTGDFTKFFFLFKICYLKCPWDGAHQSCFCAAADLCYISKNAVVSIAICLRKRTKNQLTISWISTHTILFLSVLWKQSWYPCLSLGRFIWC